MLKTDSVKWIVPLAVIALIIGVGVTINIEDRSVGAQIAIGQSSDHDFSQDHESLARINRAFIEVVNRAKPAVVQITTTKLVKGTRRSDDDFFEYWFGPRNRRQQRDRDEPDEERSVPGGLGSGVIVSEDGYLLTNNHVIEGADDIKVILPTGREYHAKVIGADSGNQGTDVAVLKIEGEDLPYLSFGNSDELQVGEWVIAIGSPFGLAQTVTRGMVSAKGRTTSDVGVVQYADFIQTDAAINRGNSGGALINIYGDLIGINTAIATGGNFSQGNVGVGFAIPINLARRIMTELIEKGEVERGWLGVNGQSLTHELADKFGLSEVRGALVTRVISGSPAAKAGLRRSDIILEFNNTVIRDWWHLRHTVAAAGADMNVPVKVIRKAKEKHLEVKLGKRTQELLASLEGGGGTLPSEEDEGVEVFKGLRVRDLTEELEGRYEHEGEEGVIVVAVDNRSPAAQAGIRTGDLILEIEGEEIKNLNEYWRRIKAVKDESGIFMLVRHAGGAPEYVVLKTDE